ncbi:MAG: hypothetical protein JO111_02825 [Caulobacteraceae bacterium]|nr:hypothetical protein [Caulobacteraceae bacterium]
MTNVRDTAEMLVIDRVEAELELGVAMIDEIAVRMPYCATARMPYCSLKANAEGAKALLSI